MRDRRLEALRIDRAAGFLDCDGAYGAKVEAGAKSKRAAIERHAAAGRAQIIVGRDFERATGEQRAARVGVDAAKDESAQVGLFKLDRSR
ncbi:hypothetical protein D3C72_1952720 [compost metagenome]